MEERRFVNGYVEGADLILLYRDPNGQMLAQRRRAEWSSFYRAADLTPELTRQLASSSYVLGLAVEGEFVRVRWQAPEWRQKAHARDGYFSAELGIDHFEADVTATRRYLADTGAKVARPRRIFLDIETDSRIPPAVARHGKARVLCWALADSEKRPVAQGMLATDEDGAEKQLLEALWLALEPYDQVCAWFGDIFDFPVVRLRTDQMGASYGPRGRDHRRWLWCDQATIYERMNKNASESGDEKDSLALQNVAMARLGVGKNEFDATKTYEEWAAGGERRERLMRYCAQDTLLLPMLEERTGHLAINDAICEVVGLFADTRSANPIEYVDAYMLRMAVERGTHWPTRRPFADGEERKKFAGAWVMEPRTHGITKGVHVCDFSGMYPSIIQSWNMSPDTKADVPVNGPIPPGHCRAPSTRVGFRLEPEGMIPAMIRQLKELRKYWSKRQSQFPPGTPEWLDAGRKSTSFKVIINSIYGVLGSPYSRFFDRAVAESVTQNGVWLIQQTIHEAEKRGIEPVYGDTDSTFVVGTTREAFGEFVGWCNSDLYPKLLAECGCTTNLVEIAYEKEFERVVIVTAKRYAAVFAHYKGVASCSCDTPKGEPGAVDVRTLTCRDCRKVWPALPPPRGKPEVRGLEYRRGDAAKLARRLQYEAVLLLMRDRCEDPLAFLPMVERARDHLLGDPLLPEEVVMTASLGKPLKEYVSKVKADGSPSALPAHVRVAHVLRDRGEQIGEGSRIGYFVLDSSQTPQLVAPAADYAGECDRHHLWEGEVWPPTMRLLKAAFPAHDWSVYDRTRPSKARARAEAAGQGMFAGFDQQPTGNPGSRKGARKRSDPQAGLFGPPPPAPSEQTGPPIAPAYVVELEQTGDETTDARTLLGVKAALRRHPGTRPVVLRLIETRYAGRVSEVGTDIRVSQSPELAADVARARETA